MSKSKINVDRAVLDRIANSAQITDSQKMDFLKYVGYMTISEREELVNTL